MNEFIVFWSFDNGKTLEHVGYEKLDNDGNYVFKRINTDTKELRKDWHLGMITDNQGNAKFYRFSHIGKTDDTPDKNKIYDDCSIVEFTLSLGVKNFSVVGYFQKNELTLSYQIKVIKQAYIGDDNYNIGADVLQYITYMNEISNLKVIGTIQENKELLNES